MNPPAAFLRQVQFLLQLYRLNLQRDAGRGEADLGRKLHLAVRAFFWTVATAEVRRMPLVAAFTSMESVGLVKPATSCTYFTAATRRLIVDLRRSGS
jgi:hypothetical protein